MKVFKKIIISLFYSIIRIVILSIPVIITLFILEWIDIQITLLFKLNLIYGLLFSFIISILFSYYFEFNIKKEKKISIFFKKAFMFFLVWILIFSTILYTINLIELEKEGLKDIVVNWLSNFNTNYYLNILYIWIFIVLVSEIFYNYYNSITIEALDKFRYEPNKEWEKIVKNFNNEKLSNLEKILNNKK